MRIGRRQWSCFDTLLLSSFLTFELFASYQVRLFYGELSTSKRYLWIAIPLYLPLAAQGAAHFLEVMKGHLSGRILAATVFVLLALAALLQFCGPISKEYLAGKKRDHRVVSQRAAAFVSRDWEPSSRAAGPEAMKCDQYQSGRRPLVSSPWRRVGYLCGGQTYPEFFAGLGIPPDYVVVPERDEVPAGYVHVGTVRENGVAAKICRRGDLPR